MAPTKLKDAAKLLKKAFILLPVLAGIAAVNVLVDPASLYRNREREDDIASLLAKGRNVAGRGNYDERLIQKYLIEKGASPDIAVLGSSGSMYIGRNIFPGKNILNNSVSRAQLLDYIGIYSAYQAAHHAPKLILIEFPPWLFNGNFDTGRWGSLRDYIYPMLKRIGFKSGTLRAPLIPDKWLNILSPSYFQASIRQLRTEQKEDHFETNARELDDMAVKRADGTVTFDRENREISAYDAAQCAITYAAAKEVDTLGGYHDIDPELLRLAEKFVEQVRRDGIQVVFFISPFHPEAFKRLASREDTRIIIRAESEARDLAERLGVQVIGSLDPGKFRLDGTDFIDGIHMKETGVKKIFQKDPVVLPRAGG